MLLGFSNKHTAYWISVSENIGDSLTSLIYDNRMKFYWLQVLFSLFAITIGKWDPSFVNLASCPTATNEGNMMLRKNNVTNLTKLLWTNMALMS